MRLKSARRDKYLEMPRFDLIPPIGRMSIFLIRIRISFHNLKILKNPLPITTGDN